jgi:hypothetical protein
VRKGLDYQHGGIKTAGAAAKSSGQDRLDDFFP